MNSMQLPAPEVSGAPESRPSRTASEEASWDIRPVAVGVLVGVAAFVGVGLLAGQASVLAAIQAALFASNSAWNLSRSAAFVSYLLLWLSMMFGLAMTNRLARAWPGGPTAGAVHEQTSLLGLGLAAVHGVALLADQYIGFTLPQLLIPFTSSYAPFWVGIGQIGLILMALVTGSFYIRRRIGAGTWRRLHYLSFAVFVMALLHGIFSGSDSSALWAMVLYAGSALSVAAMTIYRIITARRSTRRESPSAARPQ